MNTEDFMNLSMIDKVEIVNQMLANEKENHLKEVAQKLNLSYSTFTKIMRDQGNYQFNQTSKSYEKLMILREYKEYLRTKTNKGAQNESIQFLEDHLEEIKTLLDVHANNLVLAPEVYDPSCKTINKSFQVNEEIYNQFSE
ncbi:hypothetical protein J4G37_39770, partial [Microvirga sp. 3-52]|nr:hypothetical protein [Microvirga sp. 3-52]